MAAHSTQSIDHSVDDHIWQTTPTGVRCECGVERPPGNTKNRYLDVRRECAARGVFTGWMNDVIFDDLSEVYGSDGAVIEAVCADPRPPRVESLAGPRFTTGGIAYMEEWDGT